MKIVDFVKPKSLDEVVSELQKLGDDGIIMAGGTAFQYFTKDTEKIAIHLDLDELKRIEFDGKMFKIGALTTISDIHNYKSQGWCFDGIADMFWTQQIRNISTLGGNLVQIFPWSDYPVALLVLDSEIITYNGKEKTSHKPEEFFKQQPSKILKNESIITEVNVHKIEKDTGFAFYKEMRTKVSFSIMTIAVYLKCKDGKLYDVKIAAGAALGMPKRLYDIEKELNGKSADKETVIKTVCSTAGKYSWKGKEGHSDEYAAHIAEVAICDTLEKAISKAKGEVK